MNPILEKIRKCLAMAEHANSNPNEAATALRMAQALMRQHGLTLGDIEAAQIQEKAILAARKSRTPWDAGAAAIIASTFGLRVFWSNNPPENSLLENWGSWHFYGNPTRVEIAEYAYPCLLRLISAGAKAEKLTRVAEIEAYSLGFLEGIREKLQALVPTEGEARALDLFREKRGLVKAKLLKMHSHDPGLYGAGQDAGRDASLFQGMRTAAPLKALG